MPAPTTPTIAEIANAGESVALAQLSKQFRRIDNIIAPPKKHIVKVGCVGDTGGSLSGKYFRLRASDNSLWTIWFNTGGAMNPVPGPNVEIAIDQDEVASVIMGLMFSSVSQALELQGTVVSSTEFTLETFNLVSLGAFDAGDAGFTLTLIQQGVTGELF